jgi:hypothetical protein
MPAFSPRFFLTKLLHNVMPDYDPASRAMLTM